MDLHNQVSELLLRSNQSAIIRRGSELYDSSCVVQQSRVIREPNIPFWTQQVSCSFSCRAYDRRWENSSTHRADLHHHDTVELV